ncbi:thioredoxin domain-containing protein [Oscillatoria sp. FACHB-1407]|uniref:thioredoxin domain-containing protein n=1 Tax=Oscillatoria sp. FACHB-1407 TaxID=2692847 RepID=UPI001685A85C|nr:thioredoxin domain-containing protein [Oscillatoria sp. FACHB-1407]MBD2462129.1 thioredoxin domain-containing protein [Oscillatoria sp. FACHB-1407]
MPNRLAQSESLYLRKHADNPIDWYPWGDEAIQKARQEDKPIFLSIGYSSCHWCTVMEGEAFSDGAIADYMNDNFVAIKVDREERPDIDSIYMQALQMMVGQGGWPLNVFLSPDDLVPFYGGTYFPVDPKYGRPGFLQVLESLRHIYDSEKSKIQNVKDQILQQLQQSTVIAADELTDDLLHKGLEYSAGVLSSRGMGPSFPMIPYAEAALHGLRFSSTNSNYNVAEVCHQRGLDLALGGIYDHVAGGFHRYTVDPTWTVPHFEKMLYDNGQIVEYLAHLWSTGVQEPAFARAIAGTVEWLKREMTAPEGYFYAAQDADSFITADDAEPEEGAFYVWSYTELEQHLTADELAELREQFTVTPTGNFEGKIVLQRRHPGELSATVETALARLFVLRYGTALEETPTFPPARNNQEAKMQPWQGRIPAVTDTKMIVAWNSLMISGLATAAIALQNPEYLALAAQAAQFILQHQWQPTETGARLHRLNYDGKASVVAQSEDYACFIKALLDLDQAEFSVNSNHPSAQWLEQALKVQAEFDEFLWSVDSGGYYNTDARSDLVIRERSYADNATPSANGVAIANLVRLFLRSEEISLLDKAQRSLQAFSHVMDRAPQACPTLFIALDWYLNQTLIRTNSHQLARLAAQYLPTVVWAIEPLPNDVVGLVCQGLSCQEPARNEAQLQEQLTFSLTRVLRK